MNRHKDQENRKFVKKFQKMSKKSKFLNFSAVSTCYTSKKHFSHSIQLKKCMICLKKIERIIFFFLYWLVVNFVYSKVPNKRSSTFINFSKFFQELHSYLEGVRLLVLIKCFLHVRKVGFKVPNSMKIILFQEGVRLFEVGMLYVSAKISKGYVCLGGYAY